MKPIEAGCMAMVTRSPDTGTFVQVGKFLGELPHHTEEDLWETDKELCFHSTILGDLKIRVYPEKYLMRVDGYNEDETDILYAWDCTTLEVEI